MANIFWVTAKTHTDSSIFQEPEKFNPARFENPGSLPPYNFVPFGGGARICPGYELAKIETLVTIHYLVTHFTWKLCCTDDFFSRDPMPAPTQGPSRSNNSQETSLIQQILILHASPRGSRVL
ncbi:hypothetical protein K7X08_032694 [Anisodus acutangulus]|uniref:Cytochrome P450 n=1 Tax=Anisodus acutangulus TaxID=402998 RepID=A0A9Q1MUW6_9SOLA|nr:hypothetical protein K7X08_032694 [Anisodus acutangulus]